MYKHIHIHIEQTRIHKHKHIRDMHEYISTHVHIITGTHAYTEEDKLNTQMHIHTNKYTDTVVNNFSSSYSNYVIMARIFSHSHA